MWLVLAMTVVLGVDATGFPQASSPPSQTPVPAVITLDVVMQKARERSPLIEAARERERAAAVARTVVNRTANPFVELRAENLGPVSTSRLPRDMFATISQPIEFGGKRSARQGTVAAAFDLAGAEIGGAEWALAYEVSDLYIGALRARELMATLTEQHRGVGDLVSLLSQRVREGLTAEADLRKFETEHTRLASQMARVSIALQSTLLRLSSMIGEELRVQHLAAPAVLSSLDDPMALTETDISNRADVRIAARRLQLAEAAAALERARAVPDLTVTAGYKRTSGFDTGIAGVTVPIAIFDRNRVAAAQAAGEAGAARLELALARQRALADARARWVAARELSDRALRSDAELVTPAAIVRTAARSAFVEGRGDVLQLVDAERVYGEALREALELRLDATLAIIHARLALGETSLP